MGITGGFIMIVMAIISGICVFAAIAILLEIYHPENRVRAPGTVRPLLPAYRAALSPVQAVSGRAVTCEYSSVRAVLERV